MTNFPLLSELEYWITERSEILSRRQLGLKKPWTEDPILQGYRFCNVRREDDTVTIWLRKNWREPFDGHVNMPFAMLLGRLVNWPETLEELGFPEDPHEWSGEQFVRTMHARFHKGAKVFSGAYIVSTNGVAMDKSEYLSQYVLCPAFEPLKRTPRSSLKAAYEFLIQQNAIGSFIAGQIIADLKNTSWLKGAADWWHWCAKGPGSQRGLNRLGGWRLDLKWNNEQFVKVLTEVREQLGLPQRLCLQDLQNCLCEFDKYQRVKLGQGTPRSTYPGR